MTRTQFRKYRRLLRKEADEISKTKGRDYAGVSDVNANFKAAAANIGLSKYQIWFVYFDKHLSAIRNGIRFNPRNPEVASEPLRGRIIDAINYLQLLGAMLEEDQQTTQITTQIIVPTMPQRTVTALHVQTNRDGSLVK
jgi:hypothetical protein